MFVARHRQFHLGGGLPPTRSVAPYGASEDFLLHSTYKHFAPNGAKNVAASPHEVRALLSEPPASAGGQFCQNRERQRLGSFLFVNSWLPRSEDLAIPDI